MSNRMISTPAPERLVLRFDRTDRILHGFLMLSFLGCAFTGIPLLFSGEPWAATIARVFFGFKGAAILHRIFAIVMISTFLTHLSRLMRRIFLKKDYAILWGPTSMVPGPRDVLEMLQHLRYFLGLGPRPKFDHFTYWEKFDYWAVFWGMGIIGGSGLMLWFPVVFSHLLPGWLFNIALIIHGEEALLAVVFIFTIHFFNGHLRPEKFPMDTVIFTGKIPMEEVRHERAGEWERLGGEAGFAPRETPQSAPWVLTLGRTIGTLAVVFGLTLVILALRALFFSH